MNNFYFNNFSAGDKFNTGLNYYGLPIQNWSDAKLLSKFIKKKQTYFDKHPNKRDDSEYKRFRLMSEAAEYLDTKNGTPTYSKLLMGISQGGTSEAQPAIQSAEAVSNPETPQVSEPAPAVADPGPVLKESDIIEIPKQPITQSSGDTITAPKEVITPEPAPETAPAPAKTETAAPAEPEAPVQGKDIFYRGQFDQFKVPDVSKYNRPVPPPDIPQHQQQAVYPRPAAPGNFSAGQMPMPMPLQIPVTPWGEYGYSKSDIDYLNKKRITNPEFVPGTRNNMVDYESSSEYGGRILPALGGIGGAVAGAVLTPGLLLKGLGIAAGAGIGNAVGKFISRKLTEGNYEDESVARKMNNTDIMIPPDSDLAYLNAKRRYEGTGVSPYIKGMLSGLPFVNSHTPQADAVTNLYGNRKEASNWGAASTLMPLAGTLIGAYAGGKNKNGFFRTLGGRMKGGAYGLLGGMLASGVVNALYNHKLKNDYEAERQRRIQSGLPY